MSHYVDHLSSTLSLGCHLFVQHESPLFYVYRMAYLHLFHMNVVQKVFLYVYRTLLPVDTLCASCDALLVTCVRDVDAT